MTEYIINKQILRTARKLNHCPCNLQQPCPCDDFLDNDECKCGAYIIVGEKDDK